ncbi:mechanosensitive ion channel [Hellea sp.]|nr:mechanosensitive ion channel [Hellea sp.]
MEDVTKFLNPERLDSYMSTGLALGTKVLIALVIFIIGSWIAKKVKNGIVKGAKKSPQLDETLFNFLGSIARWIIMAFVFIAILGQFGVETTSIVALLGAAGLAVGLALQGAMSNLAAGVMLMIFRPYKIGDFVDAGSHFGNVEDITLFTTDMQTFDNQKIIIPNGKIWGEKIINHSHHPIRGVEMKFNVAYDDDIAKAKAVIHKVLADNPHIVADPAPFVEVETLSERSAELVVRPFTDGANYFDVRYSVPEQIMVALGAAGMTTPYPATRVLMTK